jgi:hypothetical protein
VVLAASQDPTGITLTRLARAIGSPVSSVQTTLRGLLQLGVIRRRGSHPPRYLLDRSLPATDSILEVATALDEPARTIAALARSNPAVAFASADAGGFLVARDPGRAAHAARELEPALERVRRHHQDCPRIVCMELQELTRLARSDRMLRLRIRTGVALVGDSGVFGSS